MGGWIINNLSTVIVGLIVLAAVIFVLIVMIRNYHQNKFSCGWQCGCCPNAGKCQHNKRKKNVVK